jgi:hypothetical protein
MIIRYQAMDKETNDDVARKIEVSTHTKPPDIQLHPTRRHITTFRRISKKMKKIKRMNDNFIFHKMRRIERFELRPATPHNTSQYLIANHTREPVNPRVSIFSEYMIDDDKNFWIDEMLIDEICITGGTMRKILNYRKDCNVCQIYEDVIEKQRKVIESLEQQIQDRRTI